MLIYTYCSCTVVEHRFICAHEKMSLIQGTFEMSTRMSLDIFAQLVFFLIYVYFMLQPKIGHFKPT